jgi:hypothetical protein
MKPHEDPGQFAATDAIARKLGDLRDEMRGTIGQVDDPQGAGSSGDRRRGARRPPAGFR